MAEATRMPAAGAAFDGCKYLVISEMEIARSLSKLRAFRFEFAMTTSTFGCGERGFYQDASRDEKLADLPGS